MYLTGPFALLGQQLIFVYSLWLEIMGSILLKHFSFSQVYIFFLLTM